MRYAPPFEKFIAYLFLFIVTLAALAAVFAFEIMLVRVTGVMP